MTTTDSQHELKNSSTEIIHLGGGGKLCAGAQFEYGHQCKISDWNEKRRQREHEQQQQQNPPNTRTHYHGHHQNESSSNDDNNSTIVLHNSGYPFKRWFRNQFTPVIVLLLIIYIAIGIPASEGVDCFKCSSRNGSNPACEDPFHNLNTTRVMSPILPEPHPNVIYHTPCYAGKKGRDGLFPASACIKLTGIFDTTGETLVVRHCALDSGSLTQDTELARMSHCGKFQFEGDLLRGCVLACPEDACNSAFSFYNSPRSTWPLDWCIVWLSTIVSAWYWLYVQWAHGG